MLFNSYVFIFAFLPIVLAMYALLRRRASPVPTVGLLVIASFVYYSWWQPKYFLLLLFSITVNYWIGTLLLGRRYQSWRRPILACGLILNLALLGIFKYTGFVVSTLDSGFGLNWLVPQIVLPIGISFFTFQEIAFLVDAYHGRVRNFTPLNYALFVTFFPQLIAGPIVHHAEMMRQFGPSLKRNLHADIAVGLSIFTVGLFKKVIIADTVAVYANAGYATLKAGHPLDTASAWIAVLSYCFQLYYDFSGYSDMAVGLARMFGIVLPVNFYSPYKASSIVDFWRRWHMTLSRFLRDYLYIPLGGNRRGRFRRYVNLMLTMLLGGLWHGANWTFVLWGGIHGLLLVINHLWRGIPLSRHRLFESAFGGAVAVFITFLVVTLAWVFFRADSIADAGAMFHYLFPASSDPHGWSSLMRFWNAQFAAPFDIAGWFVPRDLWPPVLPPDYLATQVRPVGLLLVCLTIVTFWLPNTYELFYRFEPALGLPEEKSVRGGAVNRLDWRVAAVVSAGFAASVLGLSHVAPFLYFQF